MHCSLEKRALFSGEACTVLKTPFQGSFLDEKMTSFHASILSVLQPSFHVGNYLSVKHTYHTRSVGSIVLRVGYHYNGSAFVVEFLFESRLPVGSSASISLGFDTKARAIATRCC